MNKHRNRPSSSRQAMSANLRKIARQNQLYGFRMALDGIAATWGTLIDWYKQSDMEPIALCPSCMAKLNDWLKGEKSER